MVVGLAYLTLWCSRGFEESATVRRLREQMTYECVGDILLMGKCRDGKLSAWAGSNLIYPDTAYPPIIQRFNTLHLKIKEHRL